MELVVSSVCTLTLPVLCALSVSFEQYQRLKSKSPEVRDLEGGRGGDVVGEIKKFGTFNRCREESLSIWKLY